MKKLIANFVVVVTLLSGSALFAAASTTETASNAASAVSSAARSLVSSMFRVPASRVRWHKVWMNAGTNVYVGVNGDGTTDLDLDVYGLRGNLLASSTGNGDVEDAEIVVYQSGYRWIKVTNYGDVYNDYQLTVNEY